MGTLSMQDRIKGGLFGVAIGDALGGTTEFMTRAEVKRVHGYLTDIAGGGVWQLAPGEVTNDTMMTLGVAEGILAAPDDPAMAIGERFLAWYRTQPKDIGTIIRRVLSRYEGDWFEAALRADLDFGQSAGNGSLMRCLPAALAYPRLADVERVSRMQSRMTHYDGRCDEACVLYNRIAHRLLIGGAGLREAIRAEIAGSAYAGELAATAEPDCEPSGFVVHTFRWVVRLLLTSATFEEVVQRAANLGGDSDTIAAIAGGLAGVHCGFAGIPERYCSRILLREKLADVSDRLAMLRKERRGVGG